MPVLLFLIALPLIEIALFVAVGARIGVWGVLGLVVLSAFLGIVILRGRMARIPVLLRAGAEPASLLAGGAMTAMGALLLIIPGFLTDIAGLVLLLPPVQRALAARLGRGTRTDGWQTTIIEGDYVVREPGEPADPPRVLHPPRGH